jgi:hypothetical protein
MITAASPARRSIDVQTLTVFLDSLQSYSADLVQYLKSGQSLCHYTTLEGVIGIITGNDLWLTHSRYSNDNEEMNYGHRLVDEVLDELKTNAAGDSAKLKWLEKLRAQIQAAREDEVYICCFCENGNLLSQWRGYADNGGGVSIEFDSAGFEQLCGSGNQHGLMRLWKVFYDRDQQCQIVRDSINYSHWPARGDDSIPFIVDALQFFVPTFKNSGFSEEKERRLVFTPKQDASLKPHFRTRRGMLVPYFSLRELSGTAVPPAGIQMSIRQVQVGPGPNKALNVESIRMMLDAHGHTGSKVIASPIPYRS